MSAPLWKRVTMSKLALLAKCQAWAKEEQPKGVQSEHAERGERLHEFAEACVRGLPYDRDSFGSSDLKKARHVEAWIKENFVKSAQVATLTERPFSWEPSTSETTSLFNLEKRDYSGATDTALCGTVDALTVTPLSVVAYDFKFGRIDSAGPQLEMLAVAIKKTFNKPFASYCIVEVSEEGVQEHWTKLTDDDCVMIGDATRARLKLIDNAEPQPGAHCTNFYCPMLATCTAAQDATNSAVTLDGTPSRFMSAPLNDAHAEWMLWNIDIARQFLDGARLGVEEYARAQGGLPLENGKVWREIEAPRTSTNVGALKTLARAKGATDEEIESCNRTYRNKYFRETKRSK